MTTNNTFDFTDFYNYHNYLVGLKKPNVHMLTWLIGFAEGDGSFLITNQSKSLGKHKIIFLMGQHTKDIQVLEYIQDQLGFGRIEQSAQNMHRYIVSDIPHISCLLLLFNGSIVMPKFYHRFCIVLKKYNQRRNNPAATKASNLPAITIIKQLEKPALTNAWLSGFTNAEGCFFCNYQTKSAKTRSGWKIVFSIGQKYEQNSLVLHHIAEVFNAGKVKSSPSAGEDFWSFSITNLKQNLIIINYFNTFPLQSKKRKSFEKWVSILTALSKKEHLDPIVNTQLIALAKTINKSK